MRVDLYLLTTSLDMAAEWIAEVAPKWTPCDGLYGYWTSPAGYTIRAIVDPDAVSGLPSGTWVLRAFPAGMTAAWVRALADRKIRRNVPFREAGIPAELLCEIVAKKIRAASDGHGFAHFSRPMESAPHDRPILVYDARRGNWANCIWHDAADIWLIVTTCAWIEPENAACWTECPPAPPEDVIEAAKSREVAA